MAKPHVSVIVPCFRAQKTIVETVAGVLAQTYGDWELVLASDDGRDYAALLRGFGVDDPRIRGLAVPDMVATGHTVARERGLATARGSVIADLDSDDIWLPDRLALLTPLAEAHGAAFDVLECFSGERILGTSAPSDGGLEVLGPAGVVAGDFPIHLVARRDRHVLPWTTFPQATPDPIRTAIIAATAPVVRLRRPLLRYRIHASSLTQSALGSDRAEASYADIVRRLEDGDAFGLDRDARAAVLSGFHRKRILNRRHLAALRDDAAGTGFLAWLLAGREGTA